MKKILSFTLVLTMLMSLSSVPVFAAEDTIISTDSGSNSASKTVTATYIPEGEEATITGVSVMVDGQTYNNGTVTLTPNSGSVTITVSGDNFTNLDASKNKLLYANDSSIGVSTDSGWTVDNVNNTASKAFELSTFQNCTTAFEIKYSNEGDASDKYTGSGIYIVYQNETVSVSITWGAMNFTYSDEQVDNSDKGWTCETGANTVKVENKGTESIVAGISYKQADGYAAISGTFDKASETIAKDGNVIFTLTLSGKPDAKLSGATIGTVTVTIKKVESFDGTGVTTEEDLNSMLSWLTAKLNAGATDIVLNLSDNPIIGNNPDHIFITRKINETIKQSDAVDGTIHLTVSGVYAAGVWPGYSGNTKLKTITLPDATVLAEDCFKGCTNLTAVYAPSVTEIYGMPFDGCDNLTALELTAPDDITLTPVSGQISWNTNNVNLKLNIDKQNDVIQNEDGTGTWNGITFKSITFAD